MNVQILFKSTLSSRMKIDLSLRLHTWFTYVRFLLTITAKLNNWITSTNYLSGLSSFIRDQITRVLWNFLHMLWQIKSWGLISKHFILWSNLILISKALSWLLALSTFQDASIVMDSWCVSFWKVVLNTFRINESVMIIIKWIWFIRSNVVFF